MEEYLQVGVITSTHGIKGEVKVFPTTDDAARFKKLKHVILDTGKEQLTLEIQNVKFFKKMVILKFKEIDDINDIEKYRKCPLLIPRTEAVPLRKDEYFVSDLIGMKIITEDDEEFGVLKEVMETGANDVYVVDSKAHGEVLLPAIKQCVKKVDLEQRVMTVYIMPGLI